MVFLKMIIGKQLENDSHDSKITNKEQCRENLIQKFKNFFNCIGNGVKNAIQKVCQWIKGIILLNKLIMIYIFKLNE